MDKLVGILKSINFNVLSSPMYKIEKNDTLFTSVKIIITNARQVGYRSNNSILLHTYWEIGKLIVEDEQNEHNKANYG